MSSGFAGFPGDGAAPGTVGGIRVGKGGFLEKSWFGAGDESPAGAKGMQHEFGIDGPGWLSPAFSTCPSGASLFLAPPTTLLATNAPFQRHHGLPQTPIGRVVSTWPRTRRRRSAVVFYYFTYLPLRGDGGWRGRRRCMCAPFYDILTTLHARTRPGGRSPRSYLRYENATPTIFLLFRRYRRLRRALPLEGLRLSSSSWPLPLS